MPISVDLTADGELRAFTFRGQSHLVNRIVDTWEMEDEWWRVLAFRRYFLVQTATGARMTIFLDRATDKWYRQSYPYPTGN